MLTIQGRIHRLEALIEVAAKTINDSLDSNRTASESERLMAWHQAALEELAELRKAVDDDAS